jgi:hypothetical protein
MKSRPSQFAWRSAESRPWLDRDERRRWDYGLLVRDASSGWRRAELNWDRDFGRAIPPMATRFMRHAEDAYWRPLNSYERNLATARSERFTQAIDARRVHFRLKTLKRWQAADHAWRLANYLAHKPNDWTYSSVIFSGQLVAEEYAVWAGRQNLLYLVAIERIAIQSVERSETLLDFIRASRTLPNAEEGVTGVIRAPQRDDVVPQETEPVVSPRETRAGPSDADDSEPDDPAPAVGRARHVAIRPRPGRWSVIRVRLGRAYRPFGPIRRSG